jgi:hypothetical protein
LTGLPNAFDVTSVASDETTRAAKHSNKSSTRPARYGYRIGNLDVSWSDPRKTNLRTAKLTNSGQSRQDLPEHIETIFEDLNKVIRLGSRLLKRLLELYKEFNDIAAADKLIEKVECLWYLCASIGATLSEQSIKPSKEQIEDLCSEVSEARHHIELMDSTARRTAWGYVVMNDQETKSLGSDQEEAAVVQAFLAESVKQYSNPLDRIASSLVYWDFTLRMKQLLSPTDQDPDEPEPEPALESEEGAASIDLSELEGLRVNKKGFVIDPDGIPVGRLVEGTAKSLAGRKVRKYGLILDSKYEKVVGRCEIIPENERSSMEKGLFTGLHGLIVVQGGLVENADHNIVGKVVEGNREMLLGRVVDEYGDIFSKYGTVIGRCERHKSTQTPFAGLEGLVVVQGGLVEDAELNIVGRVLEGDPKKLLGSVVDEDGDIIDMSGDVRGHCERLSPDDPIITGKEKHDLRSSPHAASGSDAKDENYSKVLDRLRRFDFSSRR